MSTRSELLEASRRAAEVHREFNVRDRMTDGYTRVDPAKIADAANVTVMYKPLEHLLGGFIREGHPGILVNVARPRGMVHMTCSHELGHFFLGHESTADSEMYYPVSGNLIERQADQFAYSLLVPQWLVARTMKTKGWTRQDLEKPWVIYQLSLRLGTSFLAMAWSLQRLGIISVQMAQSLTGNELKNIKQEILGDAVLDEWTRDVWLLDSSDRDLILEPALGDGFLIDLPNHSAAGYLWSIDETKSQGFRLEPFVVNAPHSKLKNLPEPIVGSMPGNLRYRLTPNGMGSDTEDAHALSVARQASLSRLRVEVNENRPWMPIDASDEHMGFQMGIPGEREQRFRAT